MENLGVFGDSVADEMDELDAQTTCGRRAIGGNGAAVAAAVGMRGGVATARSRRSRCGADAAPRRRGERLRPMPTLTEPRRRSRRAGGSRARRSSQPTVRSKFADTALWVGSLDDRQRRHRRSRARHARESHRRGRSASGAWATAPASARAKPRSSRARTSSSACKRRGSSCRRTKSCSRPTSTTT